MRIEPHPLAISDRGDGPGSDPSPMGDDEDLRPVFQGRDRLPKPLTACRKIFLALLCAPPFLFEIGKAVLGPAREELRTCRADIAGEMPAFATPSLNHARATRRRRPAP